MRSDYYNIEGFYMNDTVIKKFDNMLYSMAGVINVRTYFNKNKSRVSSDDPGAVATNILLRQLLNRINELYKSINSEQFNQSVDDYRVLHLAVSPDVKHLINDKFNAVKTLENCGKQTVQSLIFEESVDKEIYELEQIA